MHGPTAAFITSAAGAAAQMLTVGVGTLTVVTGKRHKAYSLATQNPPLQTGVTQ